MNPAHSTRTSGEPCADPLPKKLVGALPSRWARTVIRVLSVRGVTWLVLVLGLVATVIACFRTSKHELDRELARFEADVEVLQNALIKRLRLYVQVLQGSRGLFAASNEVEETEFRAYVESLGVSENYPGIIGLGYVEKVKHAEREKFLEHVAKDLPGEANALGIWPIGDREDYMVVRFIEPLAASVAAKGYDIGSEPRRRWAATESARSGNPVLTGRIELVQGTARAGALLLLPIYARGAQPVTPEQRELRLQGWVDTAFFIDEMIRSVVKESGKKLGYEVFDGTEPTPESLLCSSIEAGATLVDRRLLNSSIIPVYGRKWLCQIHSTNGNARGAVLLAAGFVGAGGVCVSLLIFGVVHSMATTGRRAVDLAGKMNAELLRRQEALQTSEDRLKTTLTDLQSTHGELESMHKELERTQLELIQAARLESVGTLAAGVAHEVKNPLQIMIMGLDYLDRQLESADEATQLTLTDMRDAALRADSISRGLLHFSKASDFTPEVGDLTAALERSLWLMRADLTKGKIRVVREFSEDLPPVVIDAAKIQQVLINLIGNAIQAMDGDGTLTVSTAASSFGELHQVTAQGKLSIEEEERVVTIRVRDSGPGIPAERMSRIFDPFYTTKSVGEGTGLGLSVVKKIVDLHKGLIDLRNAASGGLEVTLIFVAAPEAAIAAPAATVPAAEPNSN